MTSPDNRYVRNELVRDVGAEGQRRLFESSVAIVGLGGLGGPVAYYLAAAGVGTLALIDDDDVEVSNLQRQILHATDQIGKSKAASAAHRIGELNPDVVALPIAQRITARNAKIVLEQYDVVVDATDSFEAKYVLNDACIDLRKPFSTAGVVGLSGQALFVVPGKTPCLRCIMPSVPEGIPSPGEAGIIGAVPGVLGSIQALEIIRWLTGIWREEPQGKGLLHGLDGRRMSVRTLHVSARADCRCRM